jgi:hypothetical protein
MDGNDQIAVISMVFGLNGNCHEELNKVFPD